MSASSLRERTRRAVRAELADAAQHLFLEQGFEETSVQSIAERAGLSRRSFFRYFGSKEELVASKYELWSDDMVAALEQRPAAEGAWTALRRSFDTIVDYYADPERRERVLALEAVVDTSPALRAATLAVFARMTQRMGTELAGRSEGAGAPLTQARGTAIAAAAWAALQLALARSSAESFNDFPAHLDESMAFIEPRGL